MPRTHKGHGGCIALRDQQCCGKGAGAERCSNAFCKTAGFFGFCRFQQSACQLSQIDFAREQINQTARIFQPIPIAPAYRRAAWCCAGFIYTGLDDPRVCQDQRVNSLTVMKYGQRRCRIAITERNQPVHGGGRKAKGRCRGCYIVGAAFKAAIVTITFANSAPVIAKDRIA